jgi:hypothetical protein
MSVNVRVAVNCRVHSDCCLAAQRDSGCTTLLLLVRAQITMALW